MFLEEFMVLQMLAPLPHNMHCMFCRYSRVCGHVTCPAVDMDGWMFHPISNFDTFKKRVPFVLRGQNYHPDQSSNMYLMTDISKDWFHISATLIDNYLIIAPLSLLRFLRLLPDCKSSFMSAFPLILRAGTEVSQIKYDMAKGKPAISVQDDWTQVGQWELEWFLSKLEHRTTIIPGQKLRDSLVAFKGNCNRTCSVESLLPHCLFICAARWVLTVQGVALDVFTVCANLH